MTTTSAPAANPAAPSPRPLPRWGGFTGTLLGIELRRVLRNRRTLVFTFVFPGMMLLAFGSQSDWNEPVGSGNVAAYILVAMALYGASMIAASTGASVAIERAQGWSRQLRLTPLRPTAYILAKSLCALSMGVVAVLVVNLIGIAQGRARMPMGAWVACGLLTVVCTLTFAALGVFVGYLVPGETAMQVLGPSMAALAFLGNVFIPIPEGTLMWTVSAFTPMFGVAEITRYPLTGDLPWYAVVNAVVWLAVFVVGAAWRMSRDTARV
jgi:ABC-2 type transport system permease protein